MLEKVRGQIREHKKYVKGCAIGIGVCTISYISFRLGAQHGINVFEKWLLLSDPNLHKQVDILVKKSF